jgi:Protein of unknown function (DUF1761)
MVPINYWAVLVAAVAQMILGALWYGPLFGKPWAKMMGFTAEKMKEAKAKGMGKSYAIMTIGALIMSWILAHAIVFAGAYLVFYGVMAGIATGFLNWLGFVAPVTISSVLWEGKSWKLWSLNAGYYLVGLCLMGAIIAGWG